MDGWHSTKWSITSNHPIHGPWLIGRLWTFECLGGCYALVYKQNVSVILTAFQHNYSYISVVGKTFFSFLKRTRVFQGAHESPAETGQHTKCDRQSKKKWSLCDSLILLTKNERHSTCSWLYTLVQKKASVYRQN